MQCREYTNAILYFWECVAASLVSRSSSPVSSYLLSLAQPESQPGWAEPDSQREKREVWSEGKEIHQAACPSQLK